MAIANTLPRHVSAQPERTGSRRRSAVLWTIQGLLGATYLMTGLMKLVSPADVLAASMPVALPILFLRFIGLCELAGALGLVLPGLTHVKPRLTPIAASGLVIIMAGATIITALTMGVAPAAGPLVLGLLAAYVAYARR
ncbi:MAG TPA: DoxX family protein [Chloroflexota bacterium]|jgi:hypothetical protein|nr:DoxX family protein [Chloroflexota bacterium]